MPASGRRHIVHEECMSVSITALLGASEEPSSAALTPTPVVITLTVDDLDRLRHLSGFSALMCVVMPL